MIIKKKKKREKKVTMKKENSSGKKIKLKIESHNCPTGFSSPQFLEMLDFVFSHTSHSFSLLIFPLFSLYFPFFSSYLIKLWCSFIYLLLFPTLSTNSALYLTNQLLFIGAQQQQTAANWSQARQKTGISVLSSFQCEKEGE